MFYIIVSNLITMFKVIYCTEVRFASFLSGGFITAIVVYWLKSKVL